MKKYISVALSIGWVILSVFLSLQGGEETGQMSMSMTEWLVNLLARLGISVREEPFHAFLRISAHFSVFFVMGLLFAWSLSVRGMTDARSIRITAGIAAGIATMVELGKIWVPGRHLQWYETLLNVLGVWCGIGICRVLSALAVAVRDK